MNINLDNIVEEAKKEALTGKVAEYIPELKKSKKDAAGIYIIDNSNNHYYSGDYNYKFTIQSISKIVNFLIALEDNDIDYLMTKISLSPTSSSFNSIVHLENKNDNKPLNPLINAGAIVTISIINGNTCDDKFERIMDYFKLMADNDNLRINEDVYRSEKNTGDRNRSLAYYMKSTGILEGDTEDLLDIYFKICSLEVTVKDIANIGYTLANGGVNASGKRIASERNCRVVRAVMATCGLYDGSGDFAVNVGIPAKSGVGGGIVASIQNEMGIGVLGPALDEKGNSVAGLRMLEALSDELGLNVY